MMHGRIKPSDLSFKINPSLGPGTVLLFGVNSDLQQVSNWAWIEVDSIETLEKFLDTANGVNIKKRRMSDAAFLKACGIAGGTEIA